MTKGTDSILSIPIRRTSENSYRPALQKEANSEYTHVSTGLTKREYFAVLAMHGYCGGEFVSQYGVPQTTIAVWCVDMADALIEELNKTK